MWGACRYCGQPTEPGFLDCPACETDIDDAARTDLLTAVARWAMHVEQRYPRQTDVRPKEEYL